MLLGNSFRLKNKKVKSNHGDAVAALLGFPAASWEKTGLLSKRLMSHIKEIAL